MSDDRLEWIQAALGAVSKINAEVEDDELVGARCPKCEASSFIKVSDAFTAAVGRVQEGTSPAADSGVGGMTDLEIVERFPPPRRKSAAGIMIAAAIPIVALDYVVYRRFGDLPARASAAGSLVVMVMLFMTTLRRLSDQHYHRRRRWNSLFMCRRCGQLVASSTK